MKKWFVVLMLLFCIMSLFGENFFSLVQTGTPEQVQAAIKAGANVSDRDEYHGGMTPLMYAAGKNENPNVITILLNAGAEINERDNIGMTPLMYAAWLNKNPAVALALLNAGANAKLTTNQNWTALNYAEKNFKLKGTSAYDELKKATLTINTPTTNHPPVNSWVSTSFGSYRVERMWEDGGYTYVLVSYRNTTSRTFNDTVTLTALLYDANGQMLDMEDEPFYAFENGPMSPGFEGTLKISFSFVGAKRVEVRIAGY